MAGWLSGYCLSGWLVGWLSDCCISVWLLSDWLSVWLATACQAYRLSGLQAVWLAVSDCCLSVWVSGCCLLAGCCMSCFQAVWLTGCLACRQSGLQTVCLAGCLAALEEDKCLLCRPENTMSSSIFHEIAFCHMAHNDIRINVTGILIAYHCHQHKGCNNMELNISHVRTYLDS